MRAKYQKWDYLTLSDFRSSSCGQVSSYIWLWFMSLVAVAVYGSDTFTAVSLLTIHDGWTSQFQPQVPLTVAKWIFCGCIIFSFVLLAWEWMVAIKILRRGNVADSYLNPLTVTLQSMRIFGHGQGWRRFLVFASLTKSKRKIDYIAFFVHFQLKGAIRVVLAEGPRQAINALTIRSVIIKNDASIDAFWEGIRGIYSKAPLQAVILGSMAFSLLIWAFSALCLITACILWVGFLSHYIPAESKNLTGYCRAKVDKRLARIVNTKTKEAIEADEAKRRKDAEKVSDGFRPNAPSRQPTLPVFDDKSPIISSKPVGVSPIEAQGRKPTLPSLEADNPSKYGLDRQPTLPNTNQLPSRNGTQSSNRPPYGDSQRSESNMSGYSQPIYGRPGPTRSATQSSGYSMASFGSNQPLLANSAEPGYAPSPIEYDDRNGYPPRYDDNGYPQRGMFRTNASMSGTTAVGPHGMPLPVRGASAAMPNMGRKPLPNRNMTPDYPQRFDSPYREPPNGVRSFNSPFAEPPSRTQSPLPYPTRDEDGPAYEMQPPSNALNLQPKQQFPEDEEANNDKPANSYSTYAPYRPGALGHVAKVGPSDPPTDTDSTDNGKNTLNVETKKEDLSAQTSAHTSVANSIEDVSEDDSHEAVWQQAQATAQTPRAFTPPDLRVPSRAMTVSDTGHVSVAEQHFQPAAPPPRAGTAPLPSKLRDVSNLTDMPYAQRPVASRTYTASPGPQQRMYTASPAPIDDAHPEYRNMGPQPTPQRRDYNIPPPAMSNTQHRPYTPTRDESRHINMPQRSYTAVSSQESNSYQRQAQYPATGSDSRANMPPPRSYSSNEQRSYYPTSQRPYAQNSQRPYTPTGAPPGWI